MAKYWCVNFDLKSCLAHGIERELWMMQYQFKDRHHVFQDDKKHAISNNWNAVAEVSEDDRFLAYLKPNRFFAVGKVRKPRRRRTPDDPPVKKIEEYLREQRSHDYKAGYVYYTPVFYENFSDEWRLPEKRPNRYAQRIDVEEWQYFVPEGVVEGGLQPFIRKRPHRSIIRIDRPFFRRIATMLREAHASGPRTARPGDEDIGADAADHVDESVVGAAEESDARQQGFLLDSKLRKALEDQAMKAAIRHFRALGYDVKDCHKSNPFDLFCTKGKERIYVEVKGTRTGGDGVFLTAGEVRFARRHKGEMAFFLLHTIRLSPDRQVSGGEEFVIRPWDVDEGRLKPLLYSYKR